MCATYDEMGHFNVGPPYIKVRMINFDFDQNQIFKPKIHTKMNPHESCIVKKCFGTVMVEQFQIHIFTVLIVTVRFVWPFM